MIRSFVLGMGRKLLDFFAGISLLAVIIDGLFVMDESGVVVGVAMILLGLVIIVMSFYTLYLLSDIQQNFKAMAEKNLDKNKNKYNLDEDIPSVPLSAVSNEAQVAVQTQSAPQVPQSNVPSSTQSNMSPNSGNTQNIIIIAVLLTIIIIGGIWMYMNFSKQKEAMPVDVKVTQDTGVKATQDVSAPVSMDIVAIDGLIWQDELYTETEHNAFLNDKNSGKVGTWSYAMKYCSNLNFAGYDDWRLPDYYTLAALESQKSQFKDTRKWYWSSTGDSNNSNYAFATYFTNEPDASNKKSRTGFIRCVRGTSLTPPAQIQTPLINEIQNSYGMHKVRGTLMEKNIEGADFCYTEIKVNGKRFTFFGCQPADWAEVGRDYVFVYNVEYEQIVGDKIHVITEVQSVDGF